MNGTQRKLNTAYAALQGSYWMAYCMVLSFASVFLLARGYSNSEIGVIMAASNVLASFTGANAAVNPNGDQTSPATNPLAKLTFTGADQGLVSGLRFNSSSNAFEVDNVAIKASAVPEPSSWMMMFAGFAALGSTLRRRRTPARAAFA